MSKSVYVATDEAPSWMFGARVAPGDRFTLSEPEARYERDLGYVAEVGDEAEASAEPDDAPPAAE